MSWSITSLRRDEHAPRRGREFVAAALADDKRAADSAALIASELITNAVVHEATAVEPIELCLHVTEDRARLAVVLSSEKVLESRAQDAGAEGGFGLLIVDALASRWGISGGERPVVWADIPLQSADSSSCVV